MAFNVDTALAALPPIPGEWGILRNSFYGEGEGAGWGREAIAKWNRWAEESPRWMFDAVLGHFEHRALLPYPYFPVSYADPEIALSLYLSWWAELPGSGEVLEKIATLPVYVWSERVEIPAHKVLPGGRNVPTLRLVNHTLTVPVLPRFFAPGYKGGRDKPAYYRGPPRAAHLCGAPTRRFTVCFDDPLVVEHVLDRCHNAIDRSEFSAGAVRAIMHELKSAPDLPETFLRMSPYFDVR